MCSSSSNLCSSDCTFVQLQFTAMRCSATDPAGGAITAPPNFLDFGGRKGREREGKVKGRERKGRWGRKGKEKEVKGEKRGGKEKGTIERTPLAAHGTACAVQAGADCFQVPPWPGTVLPHRRLRPCVVRGWSTSAAVRRHQNPARSTDSYCHRRQQLCSGWPTCMEQSAA